MLYKMFEELKELSHNELQFVIDGYFLWAYNTIKQREINNRSWKAWMGAHRRVNLSYCKDFPRIMVEEQTEKMRELITKARIG